MPTRSGKSYLIPHKCITTNCTFWGSDKYNSKCSCCFNNKNPDFHQGFLNVTPRFETDDAFRIDLEDWVYQNTITKAMQDFIYSRVVRAFRGTYWDKVKHFFRYLRENELWITAEFARKVLGRSATEQKLEYNKYTHMPVF